MTARWLLLTLDYPPDTGGVAQYLFGLAQASRGMMDVTDARPLFRSLWPRWWPLIRQIRSYPSKGYHALIVSHLLPVGTAAWLARRRGGLPYLLIVHGLDVRRARSSFWKQWLAHRVIMSASLVIANSEAIASEIRAWEPSIIPLVITPGVVPKTFPPRTDARRTLHLDVHEQIILAVTRLVPRKGIDRLIEAMKHLPSRTTLIVIGEGNDRSRLERLARSASAHIRFLGNVDDETRDLWYAASDVFALPVRDEGDDVEGFGMVFLEAALAGLPVVAGRSGGAPEAVVDSVTGLLVDPASADDLVKTIGRLLQDERERVRFGERGRARVLEDFRWEDRFQKIKHRFAQPLITIIIPCYNHADTLSSCLASLDRQIERRFEVIVVDDGSTEPIASCVNNASQTFPFSIIRWEKNRGAAAARNEGARRANGDYLFFFDADGEMRPRALAQFLDALMTHPEASFAYSGFDFGWKRFRSRSFNAPALMRGNYICTGALIRREAFPGFDESLARFQDWDLWLTISKRGGTGVWIPASLLRFQPRRLGMSHWLPSFVHRVPWSLFGWMPRELVRYRDAEVVIRRKHHLWEPLKNASCFVAVSGARHRMPHTVYSAPRPRLASHRFSEVPMTKSVVRWLILIAMLEAVSFLTVSHPAFSSGAAVIAMLGMLVLAWIEPSSAFFLLVTEFVIGSKGGLLRFGADLGGNGGWSLRELWFGAFMMGWLLRSFEEKTRRDWIDLLRALWREQKIYGALAMLLLATFIHGWMRHQPYLFVDANAWGVLLALIPAVDIARHQSSAWIERLSAPVFAGLFWLCGETLTLFYFFSHGFPAINHDLYLWIRRTGVGEITRLVDGREVYRIFFQSHVYAALAALGASAWLAHAHRMRRLVLVWLAFLLATMIISFSRSVWIGFGCGIIVIGWSLMRARAMCLSWIKRLTVATMAAFAITFLLIRFPYPSASNNTFADLFASRADFSGDAIVSRWNLLPELWRGIARAPFLGQGFGATLTYHSQDPRVSMLHNGNYTTYAFEWGWFDLWFKMGALILPIYAWLLVSIGRRARRATPELWQTSFVISSLVALATIHVFTPYLNHPLGFMALILCEAVLAVRGETTPRPSASVPLAAPLPT